VGRTFIGAEAEIQHNFHRCLRSNIRGQHALTLTVALALAAAKPLSYTPMKRGEVRHRICGINTLLANADTRREALRVLRAEPSFLLAGGSKFSAE
jgi:hypothetical protein